MSPVRSLFVDQIAPHDPLKNSTRTVKSLVLLCLSLSATAVAWMHFTTAEVAVRVPGRLRSAGVADGDGGERTRQLHVQTSGVVKHVYFAKGDIVRQGDRLLELDEREVDHQIVVSESLQARLQDEISSLVRSEALRRAHFSSRREELEGELSAAVEVFETANALRRVELKVAEVISGAAADHLGYVAGLTSGREISKVDLGEIRKRAKLAELEVGKLRVPLPAGHLEVLRRNLVSLRSAFQQDEERYTRDINRLRGELTVAKLEVEELRLLSQKLVVHSPLDGVVTEVAVYSADYVRPGAVGILIAHAGFEFEALVPIRETPNLRLGQLARIQLDSVDLRTSWVLEGKVKSISPDASSSDEGGLQVPVYVVRIAIPNPERQLGDRLQYLRLGATGRVEIITGEKSVLCAVLDKGVDMTRWD